MSETTKAARALVSDKPIRLGTILFTLVEPHRGHEVAYNRWYERDHFYAGCMIGPFNFAGGRFVATRDLKALRAPADSAVTPSPEVGSYLALYWVLDGHHAEWNRWAVDQVNLLHQSGRMFAERDHIHTLLYRYEWAASREPDGVPPELALDHPFRGLVTVIGQAAGDDPEATQRWLQQEHVPAMLADTGAALCLTFTPLPLLVDAPGDVPRDDASGNRFLQLYFLDRSPAEGWDNAFGRLETRLAEGGHAHLRWVSPFIPTVPGTDTYTDQLW